MRPLIFFILLFAWVSACAPASQKHRKRHRNTYPYDQQVQKQKRKPAKPKVSLETRNPVSRGSIKSSLLPTILNKPDQSLMILINAGKYFAGNKKFSPRGSLNEKQSSSEFANLAAPLRKPGPATAPYRP